MGQAGRGIQVEMPVRSIGLAAVSLQGFIDAVERGVVYGWAWNPQRPGDHVEVEILHGDRHLAVVTANRFRDDLVDLEIGDGHHAFEYALPDDLGRVDGAEIEVRYAGSSLPLPRVTVRPPLRPASAAPPRPAEAMVDTLRERIAMQEQVINDMSNLLKVLAGRLQGLPATVDADGAEQGSGDGRIEALLQEQGRSLGAIETYLATFGRTLRELAEPERDGPRRRVRPARGSRLMDAAILALVVAGAAGFVVVYGPFW